MKVPTRQIQAFLSNPPPDIKAVLFHGSDFGQISERAKTLAKKFAPDLDDVFSVTRLDGEQISREPGLIADGAASLAMFGDLRLVMIKGRGTELLDGCKIALAASLEGAFLIVEASDTTTRHAIVKLFDTAKNAASIGCYADSDADIATLVREIMSRDQISLDDTVIRLITSKLGSDRAGSRMEIEKLALLAGQGGSLSLEDVTSALGDSAALAITDIAVAAAQGNPDQLQSSLAKAWHEDANAIMVLRGCQGYFRQLAMAADDMARGRNANDAIRGLRPPAHFKLQSIMTSQLRFWRGDHVNDAASKLQDAELVIKTGKLDERVICAQCLLGLCLRARALRG